MAMDMLLTAHSREELETTIRNFRINDIDSYTIEILFQIDDDAYKMLADSSLGKVLESLSLQPDEYNDSDPLIVDTANVKFPLLKSFSSFGQALRSVHFTADCFPLLENLSIEQPCAGDFKAFHTDLPNCKSMNFQFIMVEDVRGFGPSLSRSPKLEHFSSYKFWGLGGKKEHRLVLPNIHTLDLYRSDDLRGLRIWAPRMETLNLQACYAIGKVDLMDKPKRGFSGPAYQFEGEPSQFEVNCVNTSLPKGNILSSVRCREVQENIADLDYM